MPGRLLAECSRASQPQVPDVAAQLLRVLHGLEEEAVLLHALDAKGGVHGAHLRQERRGRAGNRVQCVARPAPQHISPSSATWPNKARQTQRTRHPSPPPTSSARKCSALPRSPHRAQEDVVGQLEGVVLLAVVVATQAAGLALAGRANLRGRGWLVGGRT